MLRLSFPLSLAQLPMTAGPSGQRPHGTLTGTGDQNTPSPSSKLHVHEHQLMADQRESMSFQIKI